jgi:hypothetical protein
VIKPEQIKIALKAFEELEQRSHALEKQWLMKIEYDSFFTKNSYSFIPNPFKVFTSIFFISDIITQICVKYQGNCRLNKIIE